MWAIAEGRKAARQADLYLTGQTMLSGIGEAGLDEKSIPRA